MSIERVYYCEWRDCDSHVRTASPGSPAAFIAVAEDAGRSTQHFCSWDCLLMYAGEMPPVETIPLEDEAA